MVKRILLSIVMLMLIAYLGIAITAFNRKPANQTCRDVERSSPGPHCSTCSLGGMDFSGTCASSPCGTCCINFNL